MAGPVAQVRTKDGRVKVLDFGCGKLKRADEAVGQTLDRSKLLEKVGEGGCGVVYVAEQNKLRPSTQMP